MFAHRVAAVVVDRHRQEMELDVGPGELRAGADEAASLELVAGTDTLAGEQPLRTDRRLVVQLQRRVQRYRLGAGVLQVHLQMVLQVLPDTRQIVDQGDVQFAEQRRGADAGALQDLRRGDGASAQQHLAAGVGGVGVVRVAEQVADAAGALAVEEDAVAGGMGDDGQVRPLAGLVQIATCGAGATTLRGHGPVHRAEAFLLVAVEVGGARVAGLHAGLDHGVEQRVVARLGRGHADRAVAAVVVVGPDVAGFRLAEVGQAIEVGPVFQALGLGPVVEIQGVAADVAHAVDQRRAAETLAAPALHAPVVHVRLGVCLVGPVVAAPLQWVGQGGGHLGTEVEAVVRAAGFEQQDADVRVFAQTGGQDVTGRAGTDDDVVEFLRHGSSCCPAVIRENAGDCPRIRAGARGRQFGQVRIAPALAGGQNTEA